MNRKDVDVSFLEIRNIFYANLIAFFLIKSSALIFNVILTERTNFSKIESDLGFKSEGNNIKIHILSSYFLENCETLIAAIKTQNPKLQLIRYLAWRDLDRISLFEPAMVSEFYKDKDSWEKISSCCLNEITLFTARMEKYCVKAMKPKKDESKPWGDGNQLLLQWFNSFFPYSLIFIELLSKFTSFFKSAYGRSDEDKLFADFEVLIYAIKSKELSISRNII